LIARIAHFSDTHISKFGNFVQDAFDEAVKRINALEPSPDVVIHTGDLTDNGVLEDYEYAMEKLRALKGKILVTPGNHDQRNYGQSLFRELVGPMDYEYKTDSIAVYLINSPEPDRDEGRLGRRRQEFLEEKLKRVPEDTVKVIAFHHHLVPVPYAGRETNVLEDAGDVLRLVLGHKVDLVLMGHRHVSRVLRINNSTLINAATTSSIRTRGRLGRSFNIIDFLSDDKMKVYEWNVSLKKETLKAEYPFMTTK
jgi:3',5'-cyclic AMP phosphodiesterase CpdA